MIVTLALRFVAETQFSDLTAAEKIKLQDAFAGHRFWSTILMLAILGLYVVSFVSRRVDERVAQASVVAAGAGAVAAAVFTFLRVRKLGLPAGYVRLQLLRTAVAVG